MPGCWRTGAARHSPTFNELGHLHAGICHWQFAMFELLPGQPALARMAATAPCSCSSEDRLGQLPARPLSRETIPMGIRFAKTNGPRTLFLFTVARWACIPVLLAGGLDLLPLGARFMGRRGRLVGDATLGCFNPFVLGFGALVKPDVPAAGGGARGLPTGFGSGLASRTWPAAAVAGLALGLAEHDEIHAAGVPADLAGRMAGEALGGHRIPNGRQVERNSFRLASSKTWRILAEPAQLAAIADHSTSAVGDVGDRSGMHPREDWAAADHGTRRPAAGLGRVSIIVVGKSRLLSSS